MKTRAAGILPALLASGLAACAAVPAVDTSRLYAPREPLPVRVDDSVTLAAADGRPVPVRVVYPQGAGTWPVVVFSHGMFSSPEAYMRILEHWAASGYAVVAPEHLDARARWQPRGNDDVEVLAGSRAADLTLVMDALPRITAAVPALAGHLAPPPYAGAGHSMGTYIAMLEAGLRTRNPETGAVTAHADPRIGAVVMSSDPGKMALMPGDLWRGVTVPTFMATGTKDYGVSGKGRRASDYTLDRLTGEGAPAGTRYLVLIEGADHYYGGLVHRAPKDATPPDQQALDVYLALSTAFLDGWLRDDAAAREYLRRVDLPALSGGRAALTIE